LPRSPRLCAVTPPSAPTLPDRDALGAGLLVSLSGCGFGGPPCVGLPIKEDNRDVRVRNARRGAGVGRGGSVRDGRADEMSAAQRVDARRDAAAAGRDLYERDPTLMDRKSKLAIFGACALACSVVTALGSASCIP
jgi:hypothetical protein